MKKKSVQITLLVLVCACILSTVCFIFRKPIKDFVKDFAHLAGSFVAYIDDDAPKFIKEYHGASYFANKDYLTFYKGNDFDESAEELNLTAYGDVVDLYYCDYTQYNRRYFGVCPNIFILDIQATDENYTLAKTTLTESMQYLCDKGQFHLYDEQVADDDYRKTFIMIGFDDTEKIIRYIYVISNGDGFSSLVIPSSLLTRYTNPDLWKKTSSTGDGSPVP